MGGKQVRVRDTEERAIREPEISELFVVKRGADLVHVAGSARRVDKRQHLLTHLLATAHEILVGLDRRLLLLRIVEDRVERVVRVLLRIAEAAHWRALTDPTRVESDQVEPGVQFGHR